MTSDPLFEDRADAGRQLAQALSGYRGQACVVYGLPRGGVITAKEVALALSAPLDIVLIHKLSHPKSPEYAIGAVTEDGDVLMDPVDAKEATAGYIEWEKRRRLREMAERRETYLAGRAPVPVEGKTAILVDDGIATGFTMKAAVLAVRKRRPAKVVVAAPVGSPDVFRAFAGLADDIVVPWTPERFFAIGHYYIDFSPVDDKDVVEALREEARQGRPPPLSGKETKR